MLHAQFEDWLLRFHPCLSIAYREPFSLHIQAERRSHSEDIRNVSSGSLIHNSTTDAKFSLSLDRIDNHIRFILHSTYLLAPDKLIESDRLQ